VVSGRVGNSAAAYPVQCLGIEIWQIPTVLLSNHPGHGRFSGQAVDADLIKRLVDGLAELGALAKCRGVLTGYFSSPDQVLAAAMAIDLVREVAPEVIVTCDPVLGDEGKGLYVAAEVATAVRDHLVARADNITPNVFELGWLSNERVETPRDINRAEIALRTMGPTSVLTTSLPGRRIEGSIGMSMSTGEDQFVVETPRIDISVNGAGDLVAALFTAHLMNGAGARDALKAAAEAVFSVIENTAERGENELALLLDPSIFRNPPSRFSVQSMDLVD